jgi:hypothetical protein
MGNLDADKDPFEWIASEALKVNHESKRKMRKREAAGIVSRRKLFGKPGLNSHQNLVCIGAHELCTR